jgi:hypothetical protein
VKKPNHIQRVKFPIDSSHAESKKIIKSQWDDLSCFLTEVY